MPVLSDYKHFTGRHWETGSVHNYFAYRGFKAPHTQEPYSEAMLKGISGGAVMAEGRLAFDRFLSGRDGGEKERCGEDRQAPDVAVGIGGDGLEQHAEALRHQRDGLVVEEVGVVFEDRRRLLAAEHDQAQVEHR